MINCLHILKDVKGFIESKTAVFRDGRFLFGSYGTSLAIRIWQI